MPCSRSHCVLSMRGPSLYVLILPRLISALYVAKEASELTNLLSPNCLISEFLMAPATVPLVLTALALQSQEGSGLMSRRDTSTFCGHDYISSRSVSAGGGTTPQPKMVATVTIPVLISLFSFASLSRKWPTHSGFQAFYWRLSTSSKTDY